MPAKDVIKDNQAEFTARCMQAAQILKTSGLEDVASLIVRAELTQRNAARPRRRRGIMVRLARNNRAVILDADILNRWVEVETP